MKDSPEYRKRFWRLIGVQTLVGLLLLAALFCAMLGQGLFSTVAKVVAGVLFLAGFMVQVQMAGLIGRGRGPAKP